MQTFLAAFLGILAALFAYAVVSHLWFVFRRRVLGFAPAIFKEKQADFTADGALGRWRRTATRRCKRAGPSGARRTARTSNSSWRSSPGT